jgi:hypothetical protein
MSYLREVLAEAMKSENPTLAFRSAVKKRVDEGVARDGLITELEALRKSVDESQENVVLEVMDFLKGWCAPDMKI